MLSRETSEFQIAARRQAKKRLAKEGKNEKVIESQRKKSTEKKSEGIYEVKTSCFGGSRRIGLFSRLAVALGSLVLRDSRCTEPHVFIVVPYYFCT